MCVEHVFLPSSRSASEAVLTPAVFGLFDGQERMGPGKRGGLA